MKYGLIVHFKTQNIGDDIQSYAMEKFLPHVDYLIDREHLDSFYTETGEKVAALLGGWYLHKPLNWPPSPFLKLLPVSFHVTQRAGKGMLALTDYGARWLKKFDSIGCRDKGTMDMLKSLGITAHLSGCFTLTIKPFEDVKPHGKIILADLSDDVIKFVRRNTSKETVIISHKYTNKLIPQEVVDFATSHKKEESIPTSHFPPQLDEPCPESCYPGNWSYRRAFVEGLLRFYQGASLIVTTRLHASLPCLALGTPVLMVNDDAKLSNYRLSTFLNYIDHTTPDDLISKRYVYNFDEPHSNSNEYEKFGNRVKNECDEFIAACENSAEEPLIDVEVWKDVQQSNLRLKRILKMFAPGATPPEPKLMNPKLYKF